MGTGNVNFQSIFKAIKKLNTKEITLLRQIGIQPNSKVSFFFFC